MGVPGAPHLGRRAEKWLKRGSHFHPPDSNPFMKSTSGIFDLVDKRGPTCLITPLINNKVAPLCLSRASFLLPLFIKAAFLGLRPSILEAERSSGAVGSGGFARGSSSFFSF
uniref:Uncharacterized protein n=1 Tax=Cucumis melo TaxID=3656 RepID=A0A9I9DLG1_CUCME